MSLDEQARDLLFRQARSHNGWRDEPVSDEQLAELYELMKFGPTAANCCPLRVVFVRTPEGKARLKPTLDAGNIDKTMSAPVTAILAYDLDFPDTLPKLFPHTDARSWFAGQDEKIAHTAFLNGSLQGAYFMLAARAVGLDCGPMAGFNNALVDETFFPGGRVKSNFLCNLGHGDPDKLFPRSPRLEFDEACSLV
ncbi:malonic semialdehyde reductase [Magnetofaba australis]|uniref:Putative NADH dehydrogenase/NAD(P)H nitroreductase MAIT1_03547 n=1 Tax=Magnetofaba australis IT-1 TaxID=1434232 RepID=A0A1Y2K9A9_9PROT|nr:malonic semialdehyde reductase [Magnetofaba australis]OSM05365.1 putative serine protease do-like protein [Magnetofaba australis IT-1]